MDVVDLRTNRQVCHIAKGLQIFTMPRVTISQNGRVMATVRQQWTMFTPTFHIDLADGTTLRLDGDFFAWNYRIRHPRIGTIVTISRQLGWTDTCVVMGRPTDSPMLSDA